jgi:hypothetical protein
MKNVSLARTSGQTLYAFPADLSLATWATNRILLTEGTGANTGRYTASLDEAVSDLWYFFEGASQPANWSLAKGYFDLSGGSSANITVEDRSITVE